MKGATEAGPEAESVTTSALTRGTLDLDTEPEPPELQATTATPVGPHLEVVRGAKLGVTFHLNPGRNSIGRQPATGLSIDLTDQEATDQTWVSREHACVHLDAGAVVVEDLNSANGTFVNRRRLPPGARCKFQPGEILQLGAVQLKLVIPA